MKIVYSFPEPMLNLYNSYFSWSVVQNPKEFLSQRCNITKASNLYIWEAGTSKCLTFLFQLSSKQITILLAKISWCMYIEETRRLSSLGDTCCIQEAVIAVGWLCKQEFKGCWSGPSNLHWSLLTWPPARLASVCVSCLVSAGWGLAPLWPVWPKARGSTVFKTKPHWVLEVEQRRGSRS